MNHTRPLMAAAARALAAAGWRVQCTDPYGTGDSEGEFGDASLTDWAEDFADDACAAAAEGPWVLWVARQGALLLPALAAALATRGVPSPAALALWNPVWQGSSVVTQWLRMAAMAPALVVNTKAAEHPTAGAKSSAVSSPRMAPADTPASGLPVLRQRLANSHSVRCAGYALTAGFAAELEAVRVAPLPEAVQHLPAFAGVAIREWDAAAAGARRFWLPCEDTTDTTLVVPLVNWLDDAVPSTAMPNTDQRGGNLAGLGASTVGVAEAEAVPSHSAPTPWALEVPPSAGERCGVFFIVGGPQYRVGAHRQFVRWSRHFNAAGHATCRFDRAGTGDAAGERGTLLGCGTELRSTLEQAARTAGVRRWVVFGLCDGSTLGLLHLAGHPLVAGVVAVNPWLPVTAAEEARALVNEYYGRRLFSLAFWRRLLGGEVKVAAALREWWRHRRTARSIPAASIATVGQGAAADGSTATTTGETGTTPPTNADAPFSEAVLASAAATKVPVLWALSGNDRTAAEFRAVVAGDTRWQAVLAKPAAELLDLPEADHTLSNAKDHDCLAAAVVAWLTRAA